MTWIDGVGRGALALLVGVLVAGPSRSAAAAEPNQVTKVTTRAEGAKTVITVHGSATPSFTAYRLERPARVVVDLANGRLSASDGPIDVDTWAVGQIAMAQYADDATRTARVMIGFKRPATYDVRAKGHDVIVTVTPDEAPPPSSKAKAAIEGEGAKIAALAHQRAEVAEALQQEEAKVAEARSRRQKAELQAVAVEDKRRRAEEAMRKAEQDRVAAQAQAAETAAQLQATQEARRAALQAAQQEEARRIALKTEARRAEAEATSRADAARRASEAAQTQAKAAKAELDRLMVARKQEEARLQHLKDQAGSSARDAAQADKARAEREAEMARLRAESEKEQRRLEALRSEAEQLARRRVQEAAKLAQTQAEARALAEKKTARLEEARRAAEERARVDEQSRQAEERRAKAQIAEAERLQAAAAAARQLRSTEAATKEAEGRAQAAMEAAKQEQARLEALRAESSKRTEEARGALAQVERARVELDRLLRSQRTERTRVEQVRLEAKRAADERALEAQRAAHAAALASGSKVKIEAAEREARRLAEARAKESAELEKVRVEAQAIAGRRAQELKHLDQARAEARRLVVQREQELKTLAETLKGEQTRLEVTRRDAERAGKDAQRMKEETGRLARESERLRQEVERLDAQKSASEKAAKATVARQAAEQQRLSAEHADVAERVKAARGELERLQAAAKQRLAVVPTPAKVAALAQIKDVRFSDDSECERVIVDLQGDAQATVLPGESGSAVLRLTGATLPKKLQRTLDASAYGGPVRRVSTFADPEVPGAVKVVVTMADGSHPRPRLVKEQGQVSWEFPRAFASSKSYPPQRVGAFGATSIPLQVAQASPPVQLPRASSSGNRRRQVYNGRRIDLDFKDADIHNILRLLSDVGQVNIVTSDEVKGSVTIRMRDVPWDQALDVILKAKNLGMQREGNLIRIAPNQALEKEMEAEIARAKASVELKPLETRLVPLSYADAAQLSARVEDLKSPRGKVSIDARTNTLIITDVAGNIALAEDLIRNLDTQTPQVLIEARIVEARSTFLRTLGIQWGGNGIASAATGNPTGIAFPSTVGVAGGSNDNFTRGVNTSGLQGQAASPNYVVNLPAPVGTGSGGAIGMTFGSLAGNLNINLRLSALENTGQVRIISAPRITTMDNVEASIEQGVAIPISVVSAAGTNTIFVDAKLNLTVKPHVTNEGSVIMNVQITRNEPDFVNVGARGDPTILKKQAKTEMLVRDGDTAVIGGIYTRNTGISHQKIPFVGDIPILGWLFKSRRTNDDRTELLIFITPRVVNRQVVAR